MIVKVLAFGIAKDIFGDNNISVLLEDEQNTDELKRVLEEQYPRLKKLASYMIAVNDEYADQKTAITASDEVAIIPPVSGG